MLRYKDKFYGSGMEFNAFGEYIKYHDLVDLLTEMTHNGDIETDTKYEIINRIDNE